METWIIYAFLAMISTGIFGILQKIDAESSMNRNGFILYSHIGSLLIPLGIVFFSDLEFKHNLGLLSLAIFASFMYFFVLKFRLKCLEYMSSSSYFINYRIFVSIMLLIGGQILFSETILLNEYIGVIIGFFVFYFLIEKGNDTKTKGDIKKGYQYLAASILVASILWLAQKGIMKEDFDALTYVFYVGIFGSLAALIFKGKDTVSQVIGVTSSRHLLFLVISAVAFGSGHILSLTSLKLGGDVAIVYKIISYSLVFPITYSIIFYHEKITPKKIIAFVLTIISIWLFV